MSKQERALAILKILRKSYKKRPEDFVLWSSPLELLIATVLSAQCTDKKVNEVTRGIFKKYRSALDYAQAQPTTLEREIYQTGFYKSKTKYLIGIGKLLQEKWGGLVPRTREELMELPGVSFKSANLVMSKAFGVPTGIAVDTHVNRIAPRLKLAESKDPNKKAQELEALFPPCDWLDVNEYFILHGRALCVRKPKCEICPISHLCPSSTATGIPLAVRT